MKKISLIILVLGLMGFVGSCSNRQTDFANEFCLDAVAKSVGGTSSYGTWSGLTICSHKTRSRVLLSWNGQVSGDCTGQAEYTRIGDFNPSGLMVGDEVELVATLDPNGANMSPACLGLPAQNLEIIFTKTIETGKVSTFEADTSDLGADKYKFNLLEP